MKKFLALTISLILLMSSVFVAFAEGPSMGDTDGNGKIDVIDATAIQRSVAKIISLDEESVLYSDVDGDGKISIMDCTSIQQFVAKIITVFPCETITETKPTETIQVSTNSSLKPAETQAPTQVQQPTEAETQAPTKSQEQICKEMEDEILRLVNVERKKAKLKSVSFGEDYYECAKLRAYECRAPEICSHTRPNGEWWYTVFKELKAPDYWMAGENIALYFQSAEEIVDAWMNSSGHRANILNPDFTLLAVGVCESRDYEGYYAGVQLFIKPR